VTKFKLNLCIHMDRHHHSAGQTERMFVGCPICTFSVQLNHQQPLLPDVFINTCVYKHLLTRCVLFVSRAHDSGESTRKTARLQRKK